MNKQQVNNVVWLKQKFSEQTVLIQATRVLLSYSRREIVFIFCFSFSLSTILCQTRFTYVSVRSELTHLFQSDPNKNLRRNEKKPEFFFFTFCYCLYMKTQNFQSAKVATTVKLCVRFFFSLFKLSCCVWTHNFVSLMTISIFAWYWDFVVEKKSKTFAFHVFVNILVNQLKNALNRSKAVRFVTLSWYRDDIP